jgi:hypothetical protein
LDVSNNTVLKVLNCSNNNLSALNVSNNTLLTGLYCDHNNLSTLDLSNNSNLKVFMCGYNNPLTKINLKNGNNSIITDMYANNNQNLTCIQVDNVTNANTYTGWLKDPTASYSTNCFLSVNEIQKQQFKIYPNPVSEKMIFSEKIGAIQIFDSTGKKIISIKDCLTELNVNLLPIGNYILKGKVVSGNPVTIKFIKK